MTYYEDMWTADPAYTIETTSLICTIRNFGENRTFTKSEAGKAVVAIGKISSGYKGPMLVSTTPEHVSYIANDGRIVINHRIDYRTTVRYGGLLWYVSDSGAWMPTGSSGTYQYPMLSGVYGTDEELALAILQAAAVTTDIGAFRAAAYLSNVVIPKSTKEIGEWAFADTRIASVRIAVDCSYFPTSFPDGCEIWHYTDGGNLRDSNGLYIVDSNGKLLRGRTT